MCQSNTTQLKGMNGGRYKETSGQVWLYKSVFIIKLDMNLLTTSDLFLPIMFGADNVEVMEFESQEANTDFGCTATKNFTKYL